jgi:hypothetical protein
MTSSEFDGRMINAGSGALTPTGPSLALAGLTVLALGTFATFVIVAYMSSHMMASQNIELRCDQAAVAEADRLHGHDVESREWRLRRYDAFKACLSQPADATRINRP